MKLNDQIVFDLKTCIAEGNKEFELLNVYKGLPIISKAEFLTIGDQTAVLKVAYPASICLRLEQSTCLLSDGLFQPIEAHIRSFDIREGILELDEFAYVGSKIGNRRELRVEPGETLPVEFEIQGSICHGQVIDISMGGVGVFLPPEMGLPALKPMVNVVVKITFPLGEVWLSGPIRNVSDIEGGRRIAVEYSESTAEKTLIVRYIFQRREQIRAELNDLYEAALRQET